MNLVNLVIANIDIVFNIIVGTTLLVIGTCLYKKKQWPWTKTE